MFRLLHQKLINYFFCIAQHEPARGVLQARHDMWGRHWHLLDAPGMFLVQRHDLCFLLHDHIQAGNVMSM